MPRNFLNALWTLHVSTIRNSRLFVFVFTAISYTWIHFQSDSGADDNGDDKGFSDYDGWDCIGLRVYEIGNIKELAGCLLFFPLMFVSLSASRAPDRRRGRSTRRKPLKEGYVLLLQESKPLKCQNPIRFFLLLAPSEPPSSAFFFFFSSTNPFNTTLFFLPSSSPPDEDVYIYKVYTYIFSIETFRTAIQPANFWCSGRPGRLLSHHRQWESANRYKMLHSPRMVREKERERERERERESCKHQPNRTAEYLSSSPFFWPHIHTEEPSPGHTCLSSTFQSSSRRWL